MAYFTASFIQLHLIELAEFSQNLKMEQMDFNCTLQIFPFITNLRNQSFLQQHDEIKIHFFNFMPISGIWLLILQIIRFVAAKS